MSEYHQRKLIEGWKLRDFRRFLPKDYPERTYVAPCGSKFTNGKCKVVHGDEHMRVDIKDALHSLTFKDRFGKPKEYPLYYYEWKPEKEQTLF